MWPTSSSSASPGDRGEQIVKAVVVPDAGAVPDEHAFRRDLQRACRRPARAVQGAPPHRAARRDPAQPAGQGPAQVPGVARRGRRSSTPPVYSSCSATSPRCGGSCSATAGTLQGTLSAYFRSPVTITVTAQTVAAATPSTARSTSPARSSASSRARADDRRSTCPTAPMRELDRRTPPSASGRSSRCSASPRSFELDAGGRRTPDVVLAPLPDVGRRLRLPSSPRRSPSTCTRMARADLSPAAVPVPRRLRAVGHDAAAGDVRRPPGTRGPTGVALRRRRRAAAAARPFDPARFAAAAGGERAVRACGASTGDGPRRPRARPARDVPRRRAHRLRAVRGPPRQAPLRRQDAGLRAPRRPASPPCSPRRCSCTSSATGATSPARSSSWAGPTASRRPPCTGAGGSAGAGGRAAAGRRVATTSCATRTSSTRPGGGAAQPCAPAIDLPFDGGHARPPGAGRPTWSARTSHPDYHRHLAEPAAGRRCATGAASSTPAPQCPRRPGRRDAARRARLRRPRARPWRRDPAGGRPPSWARWQAPPDSQDRFPLSPVEAARCAHRHDVEAAASAQAGGLGARSGRGPPAPGPGRR